MLKRTALIVAHQGDKEADFDGDALNLLLPVDRDMRRRLIRLSPHFGLMDLDKPWAISPDVKFPGAVARLASNWLLGQKQDHDDYMERQKK